MKYYADEEEARIESDAAYYGFPMLTEANGCTNGCMTGISYYANTEYSAPAVHDGFQEGFIVLAGTGWARIGEEEFPVKPRTSFVAPVSTNHQLKADDASKPLEIFWFHAMY